MAIMNPCISQVYCQVVTIENNLNATVEATLRAGSADRWTLTPASILLAPKQSVDVQLRLRVLRFAQRRKAEEHGQRDVFHIKACDCPSSVLDGREWVCRHLYHKLHSRNHRSSTITRGIADT